MKSKQAEYALQPSDKERKAFLENELGLTVLVVNHRTMKVTDGGAVIMIYPTKIQELETKEWHFVYEGNFEKIIRKIFDLYTISSGYFPKMKDLFEKLQGIKWEDRKAKKSKKKKRYGKN